MSSSAIREDGGLRSISTALPERIWRVASEVWRFAADRIESTRLGEDYETVIGRRLGARC
jgi:hypothetical protein